MKKLLTVSFLIMLAFGAVYLLSAEAATPKSSCACCDTNNTCSCCCQADNKAADTDAAVEDACTCGAPVNIPQQQVPFTGYTTQYKEFPSPVAQNALKSPHVPLHKTIHIAANHPPRSSPLYLLKSSFLL